MTALIEATLEREEEEIVVEAEVDVRGNYARATRYEPEEQPDVNVTRVVRKGTQEPVALTGDEEYDLEVATLRSLGIDVS